jgi:dsRNA-specific ribonuclease
MVKRNKRERAEARRAQAQGIAEELSHAQFRLLRLAAEGHRDAVRYFSTINGPSADGGPADPETIVAWARAELDSPMAVQMLGHFEPEEYVAEDQRLRGARRALRARALSARGANMSAASAEEIEAELRRDNPKGRLWECCAQLGIAPPSVRHRAIRETHQAEMTLEVGEWELTSGVHSGWSPKMVEQLAARALLAELEALAADESLDDRRAPAIATIAGGEEEDVWEVDADDVDRLRTLNPKGAVFEWCQKHKVARPRFEERRARGGGSHVRASLVTLHLSSPWFRASQRKNAEQAAAEALIPLLPDELPGAGNLDPRSALNELRQRGVLAEYVFETTGGEGMPAARRFTVIGRATLPSGAIETSEPCDAPSKREATLLAARALLERIGVYARAR